jgi:hypothetical protein
VRRIRDACMLIFVLFNTHFNRNLILIKKAMLCVCLQLSAINVGKRFKLGDYLFRESVVGTFRKKIELKFQN